MLPRLHSRHPIDLPQGRWAHKRGIFIILGGLAALFVIIPFLLSPLVALNDSMVRVAVSVAAGMGTLLLALLIGGIRGKTGWDR